MLAALLVLVVTVIGGAFGSPLLGDAFAALAVRLLRNPSRRAHVTGSTW